MKRQDITIVALGQEAMTEALRTHQVDAIVTYAPYSIAAVKQGATTIFTTAEIPDEVLDVVAISDRAIAADPQIPAKLRAVWLDVQALIARDPDAAYARMAARQQITAAEFKASLDGIVITPAANQERLLAPGGAAEQSLTQIGQILGVSTGKP